VLWTSMRPTRPQKNAGTGDSNVGARERSFVVQVKGRGERGKKNMQNGRESDPKKKNIRFRRRVKKSIFMAQGRMCRDRGWKYPRQQVSIKKG